MYTDLGWQQFGDAFYAYAPRDVRLKWLGPGMNLSEEDFSCDGRLAVFSHDHECDRQALTEGRYGDVRSFYQRCKRAIPRQLGLDREKKKSLVLTSFREKTLNALLTSILLGWRGIWGFRFPALPSATLNFFAYFALLISPLIALGERRLSWLMISIVPVSYFML